MERSAVSPDEYLASLSDEIRPTMETLDRWIRAAFPDRARVLWEGVFWGGTVQQIIGYGDIFQARPRGEPVEWFAVGLARQKRHYSVYVNAAEDGRYLLDAYRDRLGSVKVGSAALTFTRLEDLDEPAVRELLARASELTQRSP